MGAGRKSRHGVMLVEKQEWFARLITQGVNNLTWLTFAGW